MPHYVSVLSLYYKNWLSGSKLINVIFPVLRCRISVKFTIETKYGSNYHILGIAQLTILQIYFDHEMFF